MPDPNSLPPGQYTGIPQNQYPHRNFYPGDDTAVEDVHRMRMDAMRNLYAYIPRLLTPSGYGPMPYGQPSEPSTGIRPPARPRPRSWPWLFAILSPIILPLIIVYTLGKPIREWGEFIEDWFHEVVA